MKQQKLSTWKYDHLIADLCERSAANPVSGPERYMFKSVDGLYEPAARVVVLISSVHTHRWEAVPVRLSTAPVYTGMLMGDIWHSHRQANLPWALCERGMRAEDIDDWVVFVLDELAEMMRLSILELEE